MLRLFYACYFAGVGASVPFFPPYLRSLGLSGRQISLLLAVAPLLHLCVPIAGGPYRGRADLVLGTDRILYRADPGLLELKSLSTTF